MTQIHRPTIRKITHLNISLTSVGDLYDLTTIKTSENINLNSQRCGHYNI
ncbi:hypothetical protein SZ25_00416 [Candidatus Arcanobacter lacustris]|uniref:Uncharacterized protein n=1 Tax=Candidatus Arcanibacter lacustris TaxID=1607817 RepID=A0A0F5MP80_9RICK|nr:hypothetical protein SZ25_00416 [Candidatus Arcanobacter lacustris]